MTRIRTLFIFEILGKPPEHIKDSLERLVEQLGKQKGVEISRKEIHEPKKAEDKGKDGEVIVSEDMYSTFAEVEIITEDVKLIFAIVLNMLPAHVEILEPTEYKLTNFQLSSLLSELTVKIHKYDEMAKIMLIERDNLMNKLKETEERVSGLSEEVKGKSEEVVEEDKSN